MASTKDSKKTMDVSKPGQTEPDTSGRPVIVSHRPIVQDPMVKGAEEPDQEEVAETPKKSEPVTRTNKVIQPISEDMAEPDDGSEAKTEEPSEQAPENPPEVSEAAAVDAVASQANNSKNRKDNEPSPEELAKQENIQKLIASKKYFVPIGKATRQRNNRRALMYFTILILVLAGSYLVIDAGLINTGIDLPVDLVKNS